MAEQTAAQIHPVPASEATRKELTALERLKTGIKAMEVLAPVFSTISDGDRQAILGWLAEQYPKPAAAPRAKRTPKTGKGA